MALLGAFGESNEDLNRSFAAVATIGLVSSGVMSLPLSLSSYRERKILKRYQVTPISCTSLIRSCRFLFFFEYRFNDWRIPRCQIRFRNGVSRISIVVYRRLLDHDDFHS